MKFLPLIWKNFLRNKRRSFLTTLSLATSLFLLTTLRTVVAEMEAVSVAPEQALRLVTRHAVSLTNMLPLAYGERIKAVPGVKHVTVGNWFGGVYIDEANFFGQFAVDHETYWPTVPEINVPDDQKQALARTKNGAVVGKILMDRFKWKVGDRITLKGTIYPFDAELLIVGVYRSSNPPDESSLLFRFDYLNEMAGRPDQAGWYSIMATGKDAMPGIIKTVDEMFRNSTAPTKTETEKEFQLSFSGMMGNVKMLVGSVSAVVIFTILLVTAATMGMTIRERTREFGVLKSLGFTRGLLVSLIVGEALIVSLTAWLAGCLGAKFLYSGADMSRMTGGWYPVFRVPPDALLWGFVLSLAVAALTAGIPAWRASRVNIAEALRFVG